MAEQDTDTFDFELVSPERKLLSHKAYTVVIPGFEGDFGVLPKHAALLSSIRPGVLKVFKEKDGESFDVFLSGGFADVTPTSCSVLAESAIRVSDLDKEELEQELENLNEDLSIEGKSETDLKHIRLEIAMAEAKLVAIEQVKAAA